MTDDDDDDDAAADDDDDDDDDEVDDWRQADHILLGNSHLIKRNSRVKEGEKQG